MLRPLPHLALLLLAPLLLPAAPELALSFDDGKADAANSANSADAANAAAGSADARMPGTWLAGSPRPASPGFRGAIDEVIVDSRAMSRDEIRALLKNEYTGEEAAKTIFHPRISLLGEWGFAFVPPLPSEDAKLPATPPAPAQPAPPSGRDWQTVSITERTRARSWRDYRIDWRGADRDRIEHLWYRRTVTLPSTDFRGKRALLHFDAVAYTSKIFVNGRPVGENSDGFLPFDIDITDAVKLDAPNEITLLVGHAQEAYRQGWPIGAMHRNSIGITGPCHIEARPALRIDDVFINPSVRRGVLAVEATLSRPAAGARLAWRIYEGDTLVKEGRLPSGARIEGATRRWEIPWADATLWSPESPHLYRFVLAAVDPSTGEAPDRVAVTFGFREVWLEGTGMYLNGKKIRLYNRWGHTGEFFYAQNARGRALPPDELWKTAKKTGLNSVRLHGQPYPTIFLEAADRQGFLIIDETALFHRPGTEQALEHVRRLVRRDRNHPGVIMWSGSNEFQHWKVPRNPAATAFLVRMREEIKRLDPGRPVQQSAYGDTDGNEDVLNVHYPDGGLSQNWPRILYWPADPSLSPTVNVSGHLEPWDRSRPLMAGEHQLRPASVAPLVGPDYFRMTPAEVRAAHGRWYSELAILYREQDLLLFSQPILNVVDGNKRRRVIDSERDIEIARRGFAPVAFTLFPWTDNWFADETARYELLLSNDRLTDFRGEFTLVLRDPVSGRELLRRRLPAAAAQGRSARIPVALDLASLNLAPGDGPAALTLAMELADAADAADNRPAAPALERT
ncbi:MAG: hypothetical protein LBK99_14665, partial [Opitutaceae bacterium]|nr:hypothetical protein [Opitutaceae bacterium]